MILTVRAELVEAFERVTQKAHTLRTSLRTRLRRSSKPKGWSFSPERSRGGQGERKKKSNEKSNDSCWVIAYHSVHPRKL